MISSANSTLESIADQQDAIDDALEDLFILPSRDVLQRTAKAIMTYFQDEQAAMKGLQFQNQDYNAQLQHQQVLTSLLQQLSKSTAASLETC